MRKIIAFLVILTSVASSSFAQEAYRRWRIMNEIRNDKFDLVLPAVMRENSIDMWIITNKEGNFDPLYPDMGAGYTTQNGYYIFTDTGKPRIERAALGIDGGFLEGSGSYDYFGSEDELKDYVVKRDPKKIGLNMSKMIGGADGLSYTMYQHLAEVLGKKYEARFVSAEKLTSDFRSRRVATEINVFTEAGNYSYQIAEKAFSNEVITPGVTTLEDVAWWMKEQLFKNNLESSFGMPSVYVTGPDGIVATSTDRIIQRGDILMLDWGVGLMNMYTDMKRIAYVLKEGETEVPKSIQNAFDQGVKVRDIIKATIRPGITAEQNMTNIYNALQAAGFSKIAFNKPNSDGKTDVIIGCHSVGNWGHGIGPSIAEWNPVRFKYTVRPTNLLSIELFAYTPLPEWGGKKLRIPLEDDAIVTDRGVEWLYPINKRIQVIK
ncbi:MAG: M24 family metallopeptidase [Cyclobacteriaceae bacterium]